MKNKYQQGVTLIELMIVIVIIGIIASIALPSYQNYIIGGNRAAAQQFLLELSSRQQQFLMDNRVYAAGTTAQIYTALGGVTEPAEVGGNYTFTIVADNTVAPRTFLITATAAGTQLPDGNLTINHIGSKTPADKW